ncbi:MAG: hypothetical protein KKH41_08725 [Candidatus Thermoplasmatota archaeon]|nr:hypothetical protein [Euryarchaeota archaeon]MBU4031280.1 hypothetical protein [Candidatus Thermoplasmatota archaeon]MBU4070842.1 hypothetical protein [Candidatus Thermoplasmatota archaeon]MBU4143458.1 hypothetical protein [Candidatus Thermoplasmatota archaeon]MBU4592648.1 hypothetical protein [Candidatus Thermoplasmatota archaeon]
MSYCACPFCNRPMEWIPAYGQYWCHACQRYHAVPRDPVDSFIVGIGQEFTGPPPAVCQRCGAHLQFIQQYQRWYCYGCQQYA